MKKTLVKAIVVLILIANGACAQLSNEQEDPVEQTPWEWWKIKRVLSHAQGEMAGEVTQNSVILQSRLTWGDVLIDHQPGWPDGDVPGCPGTACFEISMWEDFRDSFTTECIEAAPEYDFIIKAQVNGLNPDTRYYYRLIYGAEQGGAERGRTCTFKTLSGRSGEEKTSALTF